MQFSHKHYSQNEYNDWKTVSQINRSDLQTSLDKHTTDKYNNPCQNLIQDFNFQIKIVEL